MRSEHRGLRHHALVYESQDEYLACSVPFLREGLEAGEGAIVAHTKPGLAMMREALGPDAERVRFVDVSSAYTRPTRTLASYHEVYAEQLQKTPTLRCIADVQFGPDPAEWDLWTGYEAVFNRSFGHLPAWVLCSYDANGTPDRIIEGVWQTHPAVVADDGWNASDRYQDPDELLRRLTPAPLPLPSLRPIPHGRDTEDLRERLAREMLADGVGEAKMLDMLLAATEVATNATRHGGGVREVRAGRAEGRFVCEIVDRGEGFDDPAAGYLAPRPGIGTGLWVARQLTWRIEFFRSPAGFTARLWL
jgi:anti-sigma regulatory factor (Ser/Thr protein kinase)